MHYTVKQWIVKMDDITKRSSLNIDESHQVRRLIVIKHKS